MKEESYSENIELYNEEREKPKGEWKEKQGRWYEYSDGTRPKFHGEK